MSAWLVDKVHIDLIVGATEAGADPVVATKVGRMLEASDGLGREPQEHPCPLSRYGRGSDRRRPAGPDGRHG
jgi:hypothetical protein